MRWLIWVVLLGGCLQDRTVACGDLQCPVGDVCTAGGCASSDAVSACVDKAETTPCTTNGFAGHCIGGACQVPLCGDRRIQFGEVCDDGNTDAGDGCSARCDSLEVCGNAIVDPLVGEQCDEGIPGLAGDGCTSKCTVELALWRDVTPRALVGRASYTLATDTARNRVVMFGGMIPAHNSDATTLEWNGRSWDLRTSLHTPPPRVLAMMTYDEARHRTVLFGGQSETNTVYRDDTWEWDGIDWHAMPTPTKPSPRQGGVMAYDPNTQHVILFGGMTTAQVPLSDTWSWDGVTWTQLSPVTVPPARAKASLARGPTNKLVLFGGTNGTVEANDRWLWNGANWTSSIGAAPGARSDASMTYDPIRNRTVLFGGAFKTDLWEWNGTTWSMISTATAPPAAVGYRMAFDPVSHHPVVFGGFTGVDINIDTWQIDVPAATWTRVSLVTPEPRYESAIAYDAARGNVVMFGGFGGTAFGETWIWSGRRWLVVADSAASPSPRVGHVMAFDEARGQVVMFGGDATAETWTWDGTTWTSHATTPHPPPRSDAMMTYDAGRKRIVMFGGQDNTMGAHSDLWEWNGTAWSNRTPAVSPPARGGGVLVYDRARNVSLLFGGNPYTGDFFGDTWTWDGTTWTQLSPTQSPRERDGATAVFDARTNKVVMFGGVQINDDTWQWDGTDWSKLLIPVAPAPRSSTMAAYDAINARIVLFGGYDSGFDLPLGDTWTLGYESSVSPPERCDLNIDSDEDLFVGCADPDCWGRCDPQCPPGYLDCDPARPQCGDGVCSAIEDGAICPADCPPP